MAIYLAIDNGINGALAAYDPDKGTLDVVVMPIVRAVTKKGNKNEYNIPAIIAWLDGWQDVQMVVLERAQAYPGQGSVSNFTVGRCFGIMEGILTALKLPYTVVHPKTWQKKMFEGVAHTDTKQASILVAQRLFPETRFIATPAASKLHNGMSDAALMAYYGSKL